MHVTGPAQHVREACEIILRSLPRWFGIESAVVAYAKAADCLPTFLAYSEESVIGFISLEGHSHGVYEVHCIAVHNDFRGQGVGTALLSAAETWMRAQGASQMVVKTIAESHPSPEYKASRAFYQSKGFAAERIIPDIWGPSNPCLQMRKEI